ncbi:STAS domain-containing protein [Streptomyces sp. 058-1L]|uniref:STAS domain-containing protein n=1 Tax=Streptomyces sp. 058-1L TaxID=2789266 RepID=UPI003980354C
MLLQLGARLHAVVLDMGHVPFMSIGGLRLLDWLLSYGAKSGGHVVMIGWQPAAAAARVLCSRTDRFVPPAGVSRGGEALNLIRAIQARTLRALVQGGVLRWRGRLPRSEQAMQYPRS